MEYIIDRRENKSYQYVPILETLQQQLLSVNVIDELEDDIVDHRHDAGASACMSQYKTFRDGMFYKENTLLSREEFNIAVQLYIR